MEPGVVGNEAFLREQAEHLKWNSGVFLSSVVVAALSLTFGDMGVVVPALLLKLEAPQWMIALPMVATMSAAYLAVIPMGWWVRDSMSRKKLYGWACVVTVSALALMLAPLYAGASREWMLGCVLASVLLYAVLSGTTILPCWDLFARVIAERERARLVGVATGTGLICALAAGGLGAWLLSPKGPFEYPMNFAVVLTLFMAGSYAYVICVVLYREPAVEETNTPRESFGAYASGVVALVARDRAFRRTVLAGCIGLTVVSIGPMALAYGVKERGFSEAWVGWLVALKALMGVPVVLASTKLSKRVKAPHICAALAGMTGLGLAISPICWGAWQLAPLLLTGQGLSLYQFTVVAVLRHAGTKSTQRHLTAFYAVAWVFGLTPLVLGGMLGWWPTVVVMGSGVLAAVAGVLYWRAGGGIKDDGAVA